MSVMEPGVKPDQQNDTMQLNEKDVSELGDVIRDRHLEKIADDTELPEADQSPNPEATADFNSSDQAGISRMHEGAEANDPMDDRQAKVDIARRTADQASASMEGLKPGSKVEKANLEAMRTARLEGNPVVDGLQSAPTPLSIVDHPTPATNSDGEPVVEVETVVRPEEVRKRTLRHPFKGEVVK